MLNAGVPPLLLEHRSVCGRLVKIASSPGQDVLEELRDFFPCFFHDRWGFFPGPSRAVRSQGGMGLMHKPCTAWGVGAASGAGLGSPRFAKYTRNFQGEKKRGSAELPAAGTAGFCSLQSQTNSAEEKNTP